MRLTEQTIIRKGDPSWDILDHLCFLSKNLYNVSPYAMRQEFFKTNRIPAWEGLRVAFVKEDQPDYRALPAKVAGETVQRVGECMKSFKALKFHEDPKIRETASLPHYLKKESGRYVVTFPKDTISRKVKPLPNGRFEYTVCPKGLNLKFQGTAQNPDVIRVVPHGEHITIEVVYTVVEPKEVDTQAEKVVALDFNVSAIAEFSNCAEPRLWNLKPIKSINQYYNKKKAEYQSVLPKEEKKTKDEKKIKDEKKLI